jgi:hypothetical protein
MNQSKSKNTDKKFGAIPTLTNYARQIVSVLTVRLWVTARTLADCIISARIMG